jgi:hypothetical protein
LRPYLKKTHHRKGLLELAQGVGPEIKPQYLKKQTNKQTKNHNCFRTVLEVQAEMTRPRPQGISTHYFRAVPAQVKELKQSTLKTSPEAGASTTGKGKRKMPAGQLSDIISGVDVFS